MVVEPGRMVSANVRLVRLLGQGAWAACGSPITCRDKDDLTGCDAKVYADKHPTANALANVSNVAIGVGLAGAVVGVVGIFLSPKKIEKPAARVFVSPLAGGGALGAAGTF
jgi:hypothetical protein